MELILQGPFEKINQTRPYKEGSCSLLMYTTDHSPHHPAPALSSHSYLGEGGGVKGRGGKEEGKEGEVRESTMTPLTVDTMVLGTHP